MRAVPVWFVLLSGCALHAQTAHTLKEVHRIYVGSLGSASGAEELHNEVTRYLKRSKVFEIVNSAPEADAVLEGQGEIWIRGYRALSPRARKNASYADPIVTGYLSVRLRGANDEILWSYFADPRRVTVHDLKRDLVDETTDRLVLEHNAEIAPVAPVNATNDQPAELRGGGATFPFPIYQQWFVSFEKEHPAWKFQYEPVGSDKGLTELHSGAYDFAGSDIPPNATPALSNETAFYPTVGGAVVLIYNLPDFMGELRLSGGIIARIFSGRLRTWDDPELRKLNPSAALPAAPMRVFHRSDGSGTTFALCDYLARTDAQWRQQVGPSYQPAWNGGEGFSGNEALANAVAQTPNSIGYVEFIYAYTHHLPVALVLNRAGDFIRPGLLSIMAAANGAGDRPQDLVQSIADSPERAAYPISNLTWLAVPSRLPNERKTTLRAFLLWVLTSGQRQCSALGYAPLPRNLVDQELNIVRSLK
jgi:phosphate transport system substrate-binding protein